MKGTQAVIVLADERDVAARALVERWAATGSLLMTPRDLSVAGWEFRPTSSKGSRAIASGRRLDDREIGGVIVRLPSVGEDSLPWIVPGDRAYVAAEMHAFLVAWLTHLPCPVLNRPTPTCLSGPLWRQERWIAVAARLGIPVLPLRRVTGMTQDMTTFETPGEPSITVTVVGDRCVDAPYPRLAEHARSLAHAAGVELASFRFSVAGGDARFAGASLWPDLGQDGIGEAALAHLGVRSCGPMVAT